MDFTCGYDAELDAIVVSISGAGDLQRYCDVLDTIAAECVDHGSASILVDHSEVDAEPISVADVHKIADAAKSHRAAFGRRKFVNVVATKLQYGLVRVWMAKVEEPTDLQLALFEDRDEAVAWLRG